MRSSHLPLCSALLFGLSDGTGCVAECRELPEYQRQWVDEWVADIANDRYRYPYLDRVENGVYQEYLEFTREQSMAFMHDTTRDFRTCLLATGIYRLVATMDLSNAEVDNLSPLTLGSSTRVMNPGYPLTVFP